MILEERTLIYNDEMARYSDIDVVCQEKHLILKRQPSELMYCLQLLEIQFINICFCRDSYTTQTNLIIFCV